MPIKILCPCGADITEEISAWDKKTRTVHWFAQNDPQCSACASEPGAWNRRKKDSSMEPVGASHERP